MPSFELTPIAAIKVPRNQTAAMQLIQLYAQSGHVFWTAGIVQRGSSNASWRSWPAIASTVINREGHTIKAAGLLLCIWSF